MKRIKKKKEEEINKIKAKNNELENGKTVEYTHK